MARRKQATTPGQWSESSSDSDSGNVESDDGEDDSEIEPYPEPDLALISELLEITERSPPAQEARLVLMQTYAICGWHDMAKEEARRVLEIDPSVKEAHTCLKDPCKVRLRGGNGAAKTKPTGTDTKFKAKRGNATKPQWQRAHAPIWQPNLLPITSPSASLQELEDGYIALLKSSEILSSEMKLLKTLTIPDCEDQILDLAAIAKGKVSSVVRAKPLEGVKVVAEAIVADSKNGGQNGLNAAVKDLEDLAWWLRNSGDTTTYSGKGKSRSTGNDDQDEIRDELVKRVKALKALLPRPLQALADLAMIHAEHELLHRKYVNDETMSFDAISDIPRANFWTSEDGYAWDMEELAGAITSAKGVMRNPLSKQMFTRADIRAIIRHPLGKGLQALQVEQSKLKQGVRPQTIDKLDTLAKVLLGDTTENGKPSHSAVETFVSYLETLPSSEQKAIEGLKVPAKDSHTGISFDTTIGESIKDVQGNRVCNHKTGDFLAQAVKYLK
ncbi:hypothetical protein MMC28_001111 [Mycoblastus sanguinarius]|nr:hypothetical protein [Mycoblastus sanguinarius]